MCGCVVLKQPFFTSLFFTATLTHTQKKMENKQSVEMNTKRTMPSKKHILAKIKEIEQELLKVKAWCFEHYALDSQQETDAPKNAGGKGSNGYLLPTADNIHTSIKKEVDKDYDSPDLEANRRSMNKNV